MNRVADVENRTDASINYLPFFVYIAHPEPRSLIQDPSGKCGCSGAFTESLGALQAASLRVLAPTTTLNLDSCLVLKFLCIGLGVQSSGFAVFGLSLVSLKPLSLDNLHLERSY